jgi:hypothetical protein
LAEWLYEEGIGENRAILVEDNSILEAALDPTDDVRVGAILTGRLRDIVVPRQRGWVSTKRTDVLVPALPSGITKGQAVRVEILREEILEPGYPKSLVGRITDDPERDGIPLEERIGRHTRIGLGDADRFEEAGWSDLIEEAISGDIPFAGGELRLSLTPAMTLFDVDGHLQPAELAIVGAEAAGLAIRRHGIGGSIGIDLPTVPSKTKRQDAANALDGVLPLPFERTAVNGFGFLQVVRKRERQSLPEIMQYSPVQSAARALLRRAERVTGLGSRLLVASPAVIQFLESRPDWLDELRRRTGTTLTLQAQPSHTTWSFHVQTTHT